ncbi:MAG: hypothetical protein JNM52_06620, partial [Betaproteobacteria bacterium]|nr:hypothetical protein [Betaproteobacteria bacterium]
MSQQPIRWALWILAMAALAVMLALAGQYGDGYVVFVVPPWRVELSVMLFSIILLALFSLFHWLIRLGQGALKLPGMFKMLKLERARTRAREAMLAGIKALMAGQYREAEQYARRAMSSESARADTRDLAAVIAARAAQESGNPAASLPYLARIRNPKSADMRDVTQAQMLLSESRAEEALTLLKPLAANNPRNAAVLKMKVEAEVLQQNWKDALQTLELLTRSGLLPEAAAQQIRLNAETKLIQAAPNDRETLLNQWRRLDSSARYDVGIIDIMARRLIALDHGEDARNIIEEAIDARGDEQWDSSLIALYADCKG